jgi:hypothetical protein
MNPFIRHQMLLQTERETSKTAGQSSSSASGNRAMSSSTTAANPFVFKHISNIRSMEGFDDGGPCVMMASPGMLQNGLSRELLEAWCEDRRNGLVMTGYSVEGTLAKHLLTGPADIPAVTQGGPSGRRLTMAMSVEYVSFSAHVDFGQNAEFIDAMRPTHLVLVRGESNEMHRLKAALQRRYSDEAEDEGSAEGTGISESAEAKVTGMKIYTPKNGEAVSLVFQDHVTAKMLGSLAVAHTRDAYGDDDSGLDVQGVLVKKDFTYQHLAPFDIPSYTALGTSRLGQRQYFYSSAPFSLIEHHVKAFLGPAHVRSTTKSEDMGRGAGYMADSDQSRNKAHRQLSLAAGGEILLREGGSEGDVGAGDVDSLPSRTVSNKQLYVLEWIASPLNDLLVDSVLSLILTLESKPSAVKRNTASSKLFC